ncbi:Abortive infection protein [Halalkalicoccus jeotgali B3]|uniref:Abortive infection protein n=2 Tax=Halalkalicoccus jeotgali TaxID=413810 RepID=D8JCB5_HALJB|nr:Abortive infection protein [Halalkalicoccus jeotgali B3]ELY38815.1 Abortive infection protein [Halalkalicoccus jeotgali B3]
MFIVGRNLLRQFFGDINNLSGPLFIFYIFMMGMIFLGMLLVGIYTAARLERSKFSEFRPSVDREWRRTFVAGVVISLLAISISWGWGVFRGIRSLNLASVGVRSPEGTIVTAVVILAATGMFFANMTLEEVVYRRIMLDNFIKGLAARGLSRKAAASLAMVGSLVAFGLLHTVYRGGGIVAIDAALTGTMFAFAYLLTGKLALPMGIHFGRHITTILGGESYGVVDLIAVGNVTKNTLTANLEVEFVQIGLVCLLVSIWVYRQRGSIQIPAIIYQPPIRHSQSD